jgi:hypothetical protein
MTLTKRERFIGLTKNKKGEVEREDKVFNRNGRQTQILMTSAINSHDVTQMKNNAGRASP